MIQRKSVCLGTGLVSDLELRCYGLCEREHRVEIQESKTGYLIEQSLKKRQAYTIYTLSKVLPRI